MFRLILFALFSLTFVFPAYARLGETEAQCIARYGKGEVVNDGSDPAKPRSVHFVKNGVDIEVTFLNGFAADIDFRRDATDFSADEIQTLLGDNAQGLKWGKADQEGTFVTWTRSDGTFAVHTTDTHELGISTKAFLDLVPSHHDQPPTNQLQGF